MAQLPPHTGGGYSDLCTHDCPATLTDTEVLEFCKSGFIKLEAVVPSWVNEKAFARCGEIDSVPNEERGGKLPNEPSALLAEDWFVEHVIKCPAVVGAVRSLLGKAFGLPILISNHRSHPPEAGQGWYTPLPLAPRPRAAPPTEL